MDRFKTTWELLKMQHMQLATSPDEILTLIEINEASQKHPVKRLVATAIMLSLIFFFCQGG